MADNLDLLPGSIVQFKEWSANRPADFLITMSDYVFTKGKVLRHEGMNTLVIEWETPDGGMRSLHFENEIEKYVEPIADLYDEKAEKLAFLKSKGWRVVKSPVTNKRHVLDRDSTVLKWKEVNAEWHFHLMCTIVYGRLALLASYDPDRAHEQNGVGFNKFDGEFGHSLVEQWKKYGRWSEKQLRAAIRMSHKYKGQIKRVLGPYYRTIEDWKGLQEKIQLEDKYLD